MIILTKEISAVLAGMGLDELTIDRTPDGGLALAGKECGKPILTLSNIPVSKKLTVAERKILTEDYILPALTKNVKDIITLVSLMKDTRLQEDLNKFREDLKAVHGIAAERYNGFSKAVNGYATYKFFLTHKTKEATYKVYQDVPEDNYTSSIEVTKDTHLAVIYEIKHASKHIQDMFNKLAVWRQLNEAVEVQEAKIEELRELISAKCTL
jgi:hypothetical protein